VWSSFFYSSRLPSEFPLQVPSGLTTNQSKRAAGNSRPPLSPCVHLLRCEFIPMTLHIVMRRHHMRLLLGEQLPYRQRKVLLQSIFVGCLGGIFARFSRLQ